MFLASSTSNGWSSSIIRLGIVVAVLGMKWDHRPWRRLWCGGLRDGWDVVENSKYIWEIYAATFTKNLGCLCLYFLIIAPMRSLDYITRTHLSKPNPNEIVHDDTHPTWQIQISILQERQTLRTRLYKLELRKVVDWILVKVDFRVHPIIFTLRFARLNGVGSAVSWPAQRMDSAIWEEKVGLHTHQQLCSASLLCYLDTQSKSWQGYVGLNEVQLKAVFTNGTLRCRVRVVQEAVDVDQSSPRFILKRRTRPTACDRRLTFSWSTSDPFHTINIIDGKQWFPSLSLKFSTCILISSTTVTQLFWLCFMENHSIYVLTPLGDETNRRR